MTPCPPKDDFVRLVDGSLSLEATSRLEAHVSRCPCCREHERTLRTLIADMKAAVHADVDVQAHTRRVMDRLDRPIAASATSRPVWASLGAGSMAACAIGAALYVGFRTTREEDTWRARGGPIEATIARDVGVQPYVVTGGLRPLASGAAIAPDTPLTAGFRNLGRTPVFLLLFAVDAHRTVHWISPEYTRLETNPVSTVLPVSVEEQALGTTVVLADVAPGPLRIVAVITSTPAHVSDVESLEGLELNAPRLVRQIPGADVRETVVEVRETEGGMR
jgi:hypothetical protein